MKRKANKRRSEIRFDVNANKRYINGQIKINNYNKCSNCSNLLPSHFACGLCFISDIKTKILKFKKQVEEIKNKKNATK